MAQAAPGMHKVSLAAAKAPPKPTSRAAENDVHPNFAIPVLRDQVAAQPQHPQRHRTIQPRHDDRSLVEVDMPTPFPARGQPNSSILSDGRTLSSMIPSSMVVATPPTPVEADDDAKKHKDVREAFKAEKAKLKDQRRTAKEARKKERERRRAEKEKRRGEKRARAGSVDERPAKRQRTKQKKEEYKDAEGRKKRASSKNWTEEEDARLVQIVEKLGTSSWVEVAAGLGERTNKQCRERWANALDPALVNLNKQWEDEELEFMRNWVLQNGRKWRVLARMMGRSPNEVKNNWNSRKHAMERHLERATTASSPGLFEVAPAASPLLSAPAPISPADTAIAVRTPVSPIRSSSSSPAKEPATQDREISGGVQGASAGSRASTEQMNQPPLPEDIHNVAVYGLLLQALYAPQPQPRAAALLGLVNNDGPRQPQRAAPITRNQASAVVPCVLPSPAEHSEPMLPISMAQQSLLSRNRTYSRKLIYAPRPRPLSANSIPQYSAARATSPPTTVRQTKSTFTSPNGSLRGAGKRSTRRVNDSGSESEIELDQGDIHDFSSENKASVSNKRLLSSSPPLSPRKALMSPPPPRSQTKHASRLSISPSSHSLSSSASSPSFRPPVLQTLDGRSPPLSPIRDSFRFSGPASPENVLEPLNLAERLCDFQVDSEVYPMTLELPLSSSKRNSLSRHELSISLHAHPSRLSSSSDISLPAERRDSVTNFRPIVDDFCSPPSDELYSGEGGFDLDFSHSF